MTVYLIDFDGKIENLALMRLSAYWKIQGALVRLFKGGERPNLFEQPDKVFISCIFRWNHDKVLDLEKEWNGKAEIGGTGVNITKELPPDVAACQPDFTLYHSTRAIGFISRGCFRNCPWCVVPKKEGNIHRVSTAEEITGEFTESIFIDNNFLALPDHSKDLKWLAEHNIKIDFNQGLDARLITQKNAELLSACKWLRGPRISLDSLHQIPSAENALSLLEKAGCPSRKVTVFILIGFDSIKSDITRLLKAHEWNTNVFPMGYRDLRTGKEPANGWPLKLYKKYRRLITRMPHSKSVWNSFKQEVGSIPI
jgi:hypothetical protein